jgi:hypothetical protein
VVLVREEGEDPHIDLPVALVIQGPDPLRPLTLGGVEVLAELARFFLCHLVLLASFTVFMVYTPLWLLSIPKIQKRKLVEVVLPGAPKTDLFR